MAHTFEEERPIPGAAMKCFQTLLGAVASGGASYGLLILGAWEAALIMAGVAGVLVHIARVMPLRERLVVTGAVYKPVPRSW